MPVFRRVSPVATSCLANHQVPCFQLKSPGMTKGRTRLTQILGHKTAATMLEPLRPVLDRNKVFHFNAALWSTSAKERCIQGLRKHHHHAFGFWAPSDFGPLRLKKSTASS